MCAGDRADIRFLTVQGTFISQTILGPNRRNWPTVSLFIALAFRNGLEDHNAVGRVNSGDDKLRLLEIW